MIPLPNFVTVKKIRYAKEERYCSQFIFIKYLKANKKNVNTKDTSGRPTFLGQIRKITLIKESKIIKIAPNTLQSQNCICL